MFRDCQRAKRVTDCTVSFGNFVCDVSLHRNRGNVLNKYLNKKLKICEEREWEENSGTAKMESF